MAIRDQLPPNKSRVFQVGDNKSLSFSNLSQCAIKVAEYGYGSLVKAIEKRYNIIQRPSGS